MRHGIFGRKLSRNTDERKRLLINLARELVKRGSLKTTLAKARAVQPLVEKLITKTKKGNSRFASQTVADKETVKKLLVDAKTRFAKRTSGFTRIVKLGPRLGDATEEALLMFVDEAKSEIVVPKQVNKVAPKKTKVTKPVKKATKQKAKK